MKKIAMTLALAGAMGLVAACSAAEESGSAPETAPEATAVETADAGINQATSNAADSMQTQTLAFKIDGMT